MLSPVVRIHHAVIHGAVAQAQAVPDLVLGHSEEVHLACDWLLSPVLASDWLLTRAVVTGILSPVLVLIKVDVSAPVTELIGVVSVSQH